MRYRLGLTISAGIVALAVSSAMRADDGEPLITSVIPTFATPASSSTIVIYGQNFRPMGTKDPLPEVYLGMPGGLLQKLQVTDAENDTINAVLGAVPPGVRQLVVFQNAQKDPVHFDG